MTCDDARHALYAYLDGELAPLQRRALETHVERCGACRELVSLERAFLRHVREHAAPPSGTPEGLRARIEASLSVTPCALGARPSPPARGSTLAAERWLLAPALLAAAVTLAMIGVASRPHSHAAATPVLTAAVDAHRARLPADVRGDRTVVARYVRRNVDFGPTVPTLDDPSLHLDGARVTSVEDQPAVVYYFSDGARRTSVVQLPAEALDELDLSRLAGDHQGFRFRTTCEGGLCHLLVAGPSAPRPATEALRAP